MNSFQWQIISQIFLGIGIVLMLTAVMLAARFKVISNTVSEIRSRKSSTEPAEKVHSAAMSIRTFENEDDPAAGDDEADSGMITVVVGKKKKEDISDTLVVGNNKDKKNDFRIIRNIIVINADPDVIDDNRRTK
ncbi:hypothetical protein [Ruminococcus flavefaciens]|uniref:hypothetical protein n=1 Tax=Ruminococcus flavefaciens TaxID=1265 RepID=UPI0004912D11|nr:hypothetical protein [Ruminococcus flavefaciens]